MFFSGVRLPDELRIALEQERLVIFAGAGVSMAPPSNLPSFVGLVSQIAGGGKVESGPLDRFLGKLVRERQTDVHEAAASLLYGTHTKPTLLHREILRLFGKPSRVRVVTTNFDNHFSAAACRVFRKERLREFCAPALPHGNDFTGIIYLHGSARIDPAKLVLTDRDFGAAYMTRGWARDFLVSLFSHYTVLFIGYSHDDVTTTYLARGLDPSQAGRRWAMIPSNVDITQRENWKHLDISVIEYPIDPDNHENKHHKLSVFFSQWADHTNESVFARAKRVKAIARGLPPESEGDSSYLRYCLSDSQLASEFCRVIRHPAWVGWMHDSGFFDSLFDDTARNPRFVVDHGVLTHWVCSDVRRRFPNLLLDLIQSHHQRLSREFSHTLARVLSIDQRKKPDPTFASWVSVLVSQGKGAIGNGSLGYLLRECRMPDHFGVALCLFQVLTMPELRIERRWDWSSRTRNTEAPERRTNRVDYSLEWPDESEHCLRDAWTEVFQPHLAEIAEAVARLIVHQVTSAYLLLQGVRKISYNYDRLSARQSSIAVHEQDDIHRNECLACLVDMLRCILDHWIATDACRARQRAEEWWSTKLLLLMRFAAYARSHDPQYSPDERIEWVLENDLVFRSGMKKEVFDILQSAYPQASERARLRLLRRIERGLRERGFRNLDRETLAYEKFNVLVWLRRSDPGCPLVASAISEIHDTYPKFGEREYPEFDSWHGEARWTDPTEGVEVDRVISEPPEGFVRELFAASKDSTRWDLQSYLQRLSGLFKQNKKWGRGFIEALAREGIAEEEIWNAVFWGWRDAIESTAEWEWILEVVEELPRNSAIYGGAVRLIAHGFKKFHRDCAEKVIDRAVSLMDLAWELCKGEKATTDESYGDWLTTAINHVGGVIGEFWVDYCSYLRQRAGEKWQGLPESLQSKITDALHGTNRPRVHARIALTPWIGYFFAWDRAFVVDHFIPLLDWQHDPIVAQQSWSVLLNYTRGTSKGLELELVPFYRQYAERVTAMLKDATEKSDQFDRDSLGNLGESLAVLAIQVIADPLESGFFRDFLPILPAEVRTSLAYGMGRQLKSLNGDHCRKLWNTWLKHYLDLRLVGVPVALSTGETGHMLEWCLSLGTGFAEAVERIVRMPQMSVHAYGILHELAASPAVDQWPLAACQLAIAAMQAEDYPFLDDSHMVLHEKFKDKIGKEPDFKTFEELLFRRGWRKT